MVEWFDGAHQECHDQVDVHTLRCLEEGRWYLDYHQILDQMVVADTGHCDTAEHQVVVGCLAIGSLEAVDSIGHFVDSFGDPLLPSYHSLDPQS